MHQSDLQEKEFANFCQNLHRYLNQLGIIFSIHHMSHHPITGFDYASLFQREKSYLL